MKILFSKKREWEDTISTGFRATAHELVFDELSPANVGNYDLVVPLTIRDTLFLAEMRPLIAQNPLPIPDRASVELCDDKSLLNRMLMDKGFGYLIPQMEGALPYPYLVKKSVDEWGKNSHVIRNTQHEREFAELLTRPDYFRQTLVPGSVEYATHILFKERRVAWALNVRYVFANETPIKGKDAILFTALCRCPYLDLFASVLRLLGFEGLCCVNYKVLDERPFLFEINPRVGGSLCPFFPFFLRYLY